MQEKKVTRVEFPEREKTAPGAPKKKRVVAYARVSTMKDAQENSLQSQQEYFIAYIQRHSDWEYCGIYTDDGISGLSARKREGFSNMVADGMAGKFDLVLTKSLSRFARNTVDALTTIRNLKSVGVAIYFQKENINTMDSTGEFLITLMSSFAEEESRSISENVTWAVRYRYAKGIYHLPANFMGYGKSPQGEVLILEEEARIVRFIYLLALAGRSCTYISRALETLGIPSVLGCDTWQDGIIRSILQNEKYMGDARLQKKVTTDFLTKRTKVNEGEAPQYYVENGHPGIIRKDLWKEVQDNWTSTSHYQCAYSPLANRIFCEDCGGRYGRKTWHSTTTADLVWQCNNRNAGRTHCKCRHVYQVELDAAIREIMDFLVKRYAPISVCNELLCQVIGGISSDVAANLDAIGTGATQLEMDDLMLGLLLRRITVSREKKLVFQLLDGSRFNYPLGATPRQKRLPKVPSNRERRKKAIPALYAAGYTVAEIAGMVGVTEETVKQHLSKLFDKH